MTIKQQIKHGVTQKLCHLHNGIRPMQLYHTLCQFCSITPLVLFNKLQKIICKYGCFSVSRYIKEGRKSHLWTQLNI